MPYTVLHTNVGPFAEGDEVTQAQIAEMGGSVDDLLRLGAIADEATAPVFDPRSASVISALPAPGDNYVLGGELGGEEAQRATTERVQAAVKIASAFAESSGGPVPDTALTQRAAALEAENTNLKQELDALTQEKAAAVNLAETLQTQVLALQTDNKAMGEQATQFQQQLADAQKAALAADAKAAK